MFLLSTEISSIYSQGGKGRRIHNVVFAPSFETVEKINHQFILRGANLLSDGRPIVGLSARNVAEIVLGVDERCLIIPAHIWTPYFSLYGSISGFDSVEECFGDLAPKIFAIETGLSSDPAMNWRISDLDSRRIVSFSDAHSPQKLGREATVFELPKVSYENIRLAVQQFNSLAVKQSPHIVYTIEFYPEEGKYHYTGHRNCNIVYSPNETRKKGSVCPVCGRRLTVGVMSRVEELSKEEVETESKIDKNGVRWIKTKVGTQPPYIMLVPLLEILSEALDLGVASQKVMATYDQLTSSLGGEFNVLIKAGLSDIDRMTGPRVSEGVAKVRSGDIVIEPGYDGVFGKVKIWKKEESLQDAKENQATLF
jgi:uncharacterized protein (TIGR00375 family)